MISSRKDIQQFILNIEERFPVNSWQINGFCIWPILRIRLFFYLIKKVEYEDRISHDSKSIKRKKSSVVKNKLKALVSIFTYFKWKLSLPKKRFLFVAHDAHRVDHEGVRFNRFFDALINRFDLHNEYLYFETNHVAENKLHAGGNVYGYSGALRGFLKYNRICFKQRHLFKNDSYEKFLAYLKKESLTKPFASQYTSKKISAWYNLSVFHKISFFTRVLKKIKCTQVAILCYYSENNMMLLAAANSLNIKTIEMQHGPQSSLHLCYSNWNNLPGAGYDILPRTYWCWDESSTSNIKAWSDNTSLYHAELIGNPWVDFCNDTPQVYKHQNYILYCLQPKPLTLSGLFPKIILELIRELGIVWFVRLHPRQLDDHKNIQKFLKEKGIDSLVNIDDATDDPLPILLTNAMLHVTHFSGSTIEAAMLGTKTILLNRIGLASFPEFIRENSAVYLNPEEDNFIKKFKEVLHKRTEQGIMHKRTVSKQNLF